MEKSSGQRIQAANPAGLTDDFEVPAYQTEQEQHGHTPMTPTRTRHITPGLLFVLIGSLAMAIAMPFVRREDWIGWIAFGIIAVFAVGLWVLLIRGFIRELRARWRDNDSSDE